MSKHTWATNGYNGWSNYATFRVHNDILNHHQWDDSESITIEYLKDLVNNAVFENSSVRTSALVSEYARRFLKDVDWEELVETYNYDRKAEQSS